MKNKILTFGLTTMLFISIVLISGCIQEESSSSPTPPITPVEPGYVRSYDHKLSYGFDYPEDWEMQIRDVNPPIEMSMKFTKDKEESTRIEVSIKSTNLKSLAEVKAFGYIDRQSILEDGFVEINDREAYEVVFKQQVGRDPDAYNKAKWVIFLANGREYMIRCYATEVLYTASEKIFDHVINSFIIE